MPETVTLRKPDDFHVHFRAGEMLRLVAPETARQFARALVMPNVLEILGDGGDGIVVPFLAGESMDWRVA
jgi:dihydroorotase